MSYPFSSSFPVGLQVLSAKLRGFQAAGSTISSHISQAQKERKSRLWDRKRALGTHCRYHLVAYGLLRNLPYEQIERCAPQNRLDPQRLLDIMLAHADLHQKRDLTLDKVKELMTPIVLPESTKPASTPTNATTCPAPTVPSTSPPVTRRLLRRAQDLLGKRQ